jgi:hypothetical protein
MFCIAAVRFVALKENPVSNERDSPSANTDRAPQGVPEDNGEYWRWCPRCGHELHNEKCKLRCPRCHYFMSCSDFD